MLDAVFLAMFLVVPVMFWSIRLAKQGKLELHKKIQITTAVILLVAVLAFEVDMRLNGWIDYTHGSAYVKSTIMTFLYVHLAFAIPTPFLWIVVIVKALKKFPILRYLESIVKHISVWGGWQRSAWFSQV